VWYCHQHAKPWPGPKRLHGKAAATVFFPYQGSGSTLAEAINPAERARLGSTYVSQNNTAPSRNPRKRHVEFFGLPNITGKPALSGIFCNHGPRVW
jgi:hypothetical protein